MAVRTIVTVPDPVLRRKAKKVTTFDKDLQVLIDDMIETMRAAPGVGLAAPQVGVSQRVIVVEYGEGEEEDENVPKKLYAVVNPEIVEASPERVTGVEGCLSIPRMMGEVERHERIVVKGLNRYGKPVKYKLSGWTARIFQHEIDHLEGILYTDRATSVWIPKEEEEVQDNV
ncbi:MULTISPECIES: peptide deformylase [Anaerolinea]|uniref:Peptide deformylase n=1 Tax=Anaerolinea thermophila (strain DSM 14523 / JCM 11388 / NBRC 100420 / UNI-1) TaxID=926569 RepID=E8N329_ANATU|nr:MULTISPECIES: peptide deformylase [Anaerolinea]BAJ65179.1 peptide deformylase [Anaerolinea thermophila UNI-1]